MFTSCRRRNRITTPRSRELLLSERRGNSEIKSSWFAHLPRGHKNVSRAREITLLTTLFNVSGVRLRETPTVAEAITYESADIPGLSLAVVPAQALGWKKCERCWLWSPRVGEDREHPTLCERCAPVVRALR